MAQTFEWDGRGSLGPWRLRAPKSEAIDWAFAHIDHREDGKYHIRFWRRLDNGAVSLRVNDWSAGWIEDDQTFTDLGEAKAYAVAVVRLEGPCI
jgi:hypothetical protein